MLEELEIIQSNSDNIKKTNAKKSKVWKKKN